MTIQEIDRLIEEGNSLKIIAQAYSEIANLKLKKIRSAVERNRLFFDDISKVYGIVKDLAIKKRVWLPKPKKTLHVLITSNYRFYGNINLSLINFFIESTRQKDCDKIILGKVGIDFFRATEIKTFHKEVLHKDDLPTSQELVNLVNLILEYNQVLVYYSKLKSLLVQKPTFTDLNAASVYAASNVAHLNTHFIFEPELSKILAFFDSQILILLLEQVFLESELSRTTSRFISMDQAETEANKFIREQLKLKAHTERSLENIKILENFATLYVTKKGLYP